MDRTVDRYGCYRSGKDGGTELIIDMSVADSEKQMMEEMWKKALERLKILGEG